MYIYISNILCPIGNTPISDFPPPTQPPPLLGARVAGGAALGRAGVEGGSLMDIVPYWISDIGYLFVLIYIWAYNMAAAH